MCKIGFLSCTNSDSHQKNVDFLLILFFKASALWADAFYKSKCPSVCVSVCPLVCSLLRYRLTVFLPPLPEIRCPIFFRDSESLGRSNGKNWSQILTFLFGSGLNSPRKNKFVFLLILPYKIWWQPRFPID